MHAPPAAMYGGLLPPPPPGGWNLPGPDYNPLVWREKDPENYPGYTDMYCDMCGRWAEDSHLRSQNHKHLLEEWRKPQGIAGTRPDMPRPQAQLALPLPPPKATPPPPPEWPPIAVLPAAGPQVAAVLRADAVIAPTTQGGGTAAAFPLREGSPLRCKGGERAKSAAGAATGATVSTTQGSGTASLAARAAIAPTTQGSGTLSSAAGGATVSTTQDSGTLSSAAGGATVSTTQDSGTLSSAAGGATVSTTGNAVVTVSAPYITGVSCLTAFWALEARGPRDESLFAKPKPKLKPKALPLAITPLQAAQNHAVDVGVASLAAGANMAAAELAAELAAETGAGEVQRTTQQFSIGDPQTDNNTPLLMPRWVSFADRGKLASTGLAGAAQTDAQVVSGPPVEQQVPGQMVELVPRAPGDRPAPAPHKYISPDQMLELEEYICNHVQVQVTLHWAYLLQLCQNPAPATGQTEEPVDSVTGGRQPDEEAV
jgi:hypothetical protein